MFGNKILSFGPKICPADVSSELYCISGLQYLDPSGQWQDAVFKGFGHDRSGSLIPAISGAGDLARNLPDQYPLDSQWQFPLRPSTTGSTDYWLRTSISMWPADPTGLPSDVWSAFTAPSSPLGAWGHVFPTSIEPYTILQPGDDLYTTCTSSSSYGFNSWRVAWDGNLTHPCWIKTDFAQDFKIRFSFVVPNSFGGWFWGRMDNPNVTMTTQNSKANRVTIEAGTVAVPAQYNIDPCKYLDPLKAASGILLAGCPNSWTLAVQTFEPNRPGQETTSGGSAQAAEHPALVDVLPLAQADFANTSSAVFREWGFEQFGDPNAPCTASNSLVQGVLGTNAMSVQPTMPTFDPATGNFTYAMAGMHYWPDGATEFLGQYDFLVRPDVLSCVYGFDPTQSSSLGAQAEIRDDGVAQAQTTQNVVVNSEWVRVNVRNFHFSSISAAVKFTGTKLPGNQLVQTPLPTMYGANSEGMTAVRAATTAYLSAGGWDSGVTLSYQWFVNGVAVAKATGLTYVPLAADVGKLLTVRVTGAKAGYRSVTVSSKGWAIGPAPVSPAAPAKPTGTAGNTTVNLSWTKPADGGSPITGYVTTMSTSATGTYKSIACTGASPTATTCTVSALKNGTSYWFKVAAKNAIGTSAPSAAVGPLIPSPTVPLAPAAPALISGDSQLSVTWSAPNNGGAVIDGYQLQYSTSPSSGWTSIPIGTGTTCSGTLPVSPLNCVVTNLTNGTTYYLQVRAHNALGWSDWSLASAGATPQAATAPSSVGSLAFKAGAKNSGKGTVSWTAAVANGSSVVRYEYRLKLKSATWPSPASWTSVGLNLSVALSLASKTQYDIEVRAVNSIGAGTAAPLSFTTP